VTQPIVNRLFYFRPKPDFSVKTSLCRQALQKESPG
jgi:hypothetical protein